MVVPTFLELKKLQAWVEVDKKHLPCHAMFVDKREKTVNCWIASEESKCFSVALAKPEVTCSIRIVLFLDGNKASTYWLTKQKIYTVIFDTVQTSKDTEKPFKFAPLEVTDDDKYLDNILLFRNNVQKIGEITVEVHRVTHLRILEKRKKKKSKKYESDFENFDYPKNDLKIQKVHESSHKTTSVSHQIGYGEEREIVRHYPNCASDSEDTYYTDIRYNDIKELVARFTFKYRPIETLRSCGIVPRSILIRVPRLLPTTQAQTQQSADSSLPLAPQSVHNLKGQQSRIVFPQGGGSPLQTEPQSPPGSEVTVRREGSWDDIYGQLQPPNPIEAALRTGDTNMSSRTSQEGFPMSKFQQSLHETKPELISEEDERDEEIKALQARAKMLLEEKRKRKEEKQSPRKRIKREESPMVFFRPGEIRRVVDLD